MSKAALATDPFVPFGPGTLAGRAGAANLKVVPAGADGFSPFQPGAGGPVHGAAGGHVHGTGQPTVTLQREGDKVVGIRVECGCGQVIELACAY